ncbi:hypothetical protein C8J57DRAFT_1311173 [Mycena rebaudengoi]|nr:hypothetical protein C8J57DRAFT_1311173 [Mycena rebaudengoi]
MPTYNSFALVGGGSIGLPILNALAAQNVSVVLLSRPGSASKSVPSGVKTATVDTADVNAVAAVLRQHKVEVVLSTIAASAGAAQLVLADAGKLAGVKLFVPSEYGVPTEGQKHGLLALKDQVAAHLRTIGILSIRIYTGLFIEFIPWLVGFGDHGKIRIVGKGTPPVSFTSIGDIAGFVAYILTSLPLSELENKIFRLQGDRVSLNELGGLFKTTVEHVDEITGEDGELKTHLLKLMDTGVGSTGWNVVKGTEGSGSEGAGSGIRRGLVISGRLFAIFAGTMFN